MSGVLSSGVSVYNPNKDEEENISQIYTIKGKYQMAAGKLFTGDIGAVVKLQYTDTNDTLCTKEKVVTYEPISFVTPMLPKTVVPKSKNDEDKLSQALQRVA